MRKTIRHPETMRRKRSSDPYAGIDRRVDFHGMTVAEAERVISNVISSNPGQTVLINHGKGEGILRTALRNFCSNDPRIKRIRKGEETVIPGGEGITIIEL